MSDWIGIAGFLVVWWALQVYVLPRLGVAT